MTKLQATKTMPWPVAILALPLLLVGCVTPDVGSDADTDDATAGSATGIAEEAYIYTFPILESYNMMFGQVVSGMKVVRKIEASPTTARGVHGNVPREPVIIESVRRRE